MRVFQSCQGVWHYLWVFRVCIPSFCSSASHSYISVPICWHSRQCASKAIPVGYITCDCNMLGSPKVWLAQQRAALKWQSSFPRVPYCKVCLYKSLALWATSIYIFAAKTIKVSFFTRVIFGTPLACYWAALHWYWNVLFGVLLECIRVLFGTPLARYWAALHSH